MVLTPRVLNGYKPADYLSYPRSTGEGATSLNLSRAVHVLTSPYVTKTKMDHAARRLLLLVIVGCVALVYVYPLTLSTPLLDPDEGLHASIAQEMVERGDYVVPRFCGEPFRDKPIAYFLAQAISLRLFGMNEAAVRLPGILFALVGCLTTAALARRLYDQEVGWYAVVAALTLVLPVMLAQSPAHDIALVPAINLLAICYWGAEHATSGPVRWRWLIGGALCAALALLTKGLIGIAVFSVGIALYVLATRSYSWRQVGNCLFVMVVGAILASPWFLAMEHASPGYLKYYFFDRHLLGYVTEGQFHGQAPWYYYVAPVFGGSMPWLLYALAAVGQLWYDGRQARERRATLFLVCWFVGGFLFLTSANSKLLTYALPLFPPVAVLAGVAFSRLLRGTLAPAVRAGMTTSFRLSCVFGVFGTVITLQVFNYSLTAPSPAFAYVVAVVAAVVIGAALLLFERGRRQTAFAVGILWFPLSFFSLIHGPFQLFAEKYSQQTLAEQIAARAELPDQLIMIGEHVGSLMFYLTPDQREWFRQGRIHNAFRTELDNFGSLPTNWTFVIEDKELGRTPHADKVRRDDHTKVGRFHVLDSAASNIAELLPSTGSNRK